METKDRRPLFYRLSEDKKPIPVNDITKYEREFDISKRRVAKTKVNGYRVSTVFLSIDHSFDEGPPVLFETMVFPADDWMDVYCRRYHTWEEAEKGHEETVQAVKEGRIPEKE